LTPVKIRGGVGEISGSIVVTYDQISG